MAAHCSGCVSGVYQNAARLRRGQSTILRGRDAPAEGGPVYASCGGVVIAVEAFDAVMPGPNQLDRLREDVEITAKDLLTFEPEGPITEALGRLFAVAEAYPQLTATAGSASLAIGANAPLTVTDRKSTRLNSSH